MFKNLLFYFLFAHLLCSTMQAQEKLALDPKLEVAASFGPYRPIGVSATSTNRLFVSFPKQNKDYRYALTEIIDGKSTPYPNEAWNSQGDESSHFVNVQDIFVDAQDNLWVLDSKPSTSGSIFGPDGAAPTGQFKLLKIDTKNNQIARIYTFDDLDKAKSGLNDVRIDLEKNLAYLSDPGQAAIIVLDLQSGNSRKVLEKSSFTLADPEVVISYSGIDMRYKDGKPFLSHVNGIALSHDFNYFYFKPINKKNLYRISTKYLADDTLSQSALQGKVEDMGNVGVTHGLLADRNDNIYLTTSMDYSIKYLSPDGQIHLLTQDPRLLWPDSLGIDGNGYLYFSCAQLSRDPQWNNGIDRVELPYQVYKIKLPK